MADLGRKAPLSTPDRAEIPNGLGLGVSAGMVLGAIGLLVALGFVGLLRFHFGGVDDGSSSSHITPATTFEYRHPDSGSPAAPVAHAVLPHGDSDVEAPHAVAHPFVVRAATGGLKVRHNTGSDASDESAATEGSGTDEGQPASGTATAAVTVNDGADSQTTDRGEPSVEPTDAQASRARQEADDAADMLEAEAARARQSAQDALDAGRGTQADLDRAMMLEAQEQLRAQRMREAAATNEIQALARTRARRTRLAGTGNR